MESDKELLRQGNYREALGDNYTDKPIYVMLFKGQEFVDQLDERFTTKKEAVEWLQANKTLKNGENWVFGNVNAEWL